MKKILMIKKNDTIITHVLTIHHIIIVQCTTTQCTLKHDIKNYTLFYTPTTMTLECVEWNAHLISTNFFLLFFFCISNKHLQFFLYIIFSFIIFTFILILILIQHYTFCFIMKATYKKKYNYGVWNRSTIVYISLLLYSGKNVECKKKCNGEYNEPYNLMPLYLTWWLFDLYVCYFMFCF